MGNKKSGVIMKAAAEHTSIKAIVEEYTNKLWNDKDLSIMDKLMSDDVVAHSLLGDFHGIKAVKEIAGTWFTGFPDLRVHNDIVISENDMVSTQWHVKATHKGEFRGRKPTGKPVAYTGATIYRLRNGKIVAYWVYIDMEHLLKQLQ